MTDLLERARTLRESGNPRGALILAEQAVQESPEALPLAGLALMDTGDYIGALSVYEFLRTVQPENPSHHWHYATCQERLGALKAATYAYRDACRYLRPGEPGYASVHAQLGNLLYRRGE